MAIYDDEILGQGGGRLPIGAEGSMDEILGSEMMGDYGQFARTPGLSAVAPQARRLPSPFMDMGYIYPAGDIASAGAFDMGGQPRIPGPDFSAYRRGNLGGMPSPADMSMVHNVTKRRGAGASGSWASTWQEAADSARRDPNISVLLQGTKDWGQHADEDKILLKDWFSYYADSHLTLEEAEEHYNKHVSKFLETQGIGRSPVDDAVDRSLADAAPPGRTFNNPFVYDRAIGQGLGS